MVRSAPTLTKSRSAKMRSMWCLESVETVNKYRLLRKF